MPIFPGHRKFLRFCYQGRHYQYRALPFGLSSALRVLTKIMASLMALLRPFPVRISFYLDDLLVLSSSHSQGNSDVQVALQTLRSHGFLVNRAKRILIPSTGIPHLGAVIDIVSLQFPHSGTPS